MMGEWFNNLLRIDPTQLEGEMLQLLVMRHAKSDWTGDFAEDHDRPLAPRGVKAARMIGRFLAASGHGPDLVIASTAERARDTVEHVLESAKLSCPVTSTRDLYGTHPSAALEIVADRAELPRLLIVGHEPTWSGLISLLTGGGRVRMPTAAVACIEFGVDKWSEVTVGSGQLRWLVTPRLLKKWRG